MVTPSKNMLATFIDFMVKGDNLLNSRIIGPLMCNNKQGWVSNLPPHIRRQMKKGKLAI